MLIITQHWTPLTSTVLTQNLRDISIYFLLRSTEEWVLNHNMRNKWQNWDFWPNGLFKASMREFSLVLNDVKRETRDGLRFSLMFFRSSGLLRFCYFKKMPFIAQLVCPESHSSFYLIRQGFKKLIMNLRDGPSIRMCTIPDTQNHIKQSAFTHSSVI